MAMAFQERRELNEQRPVKLMGERMAAQRSVPARSRAATARKLEEIAPEPEVVEEEEALPALKPRNRAAQCILSTQVRVSDLWRLHHTELEPYERPRRPVALITEVQRSISPAHESKLHRLSAHRHPGGTHWLLGVRPVAQATVY